MVGHADTSASTSACRRSRRLTPGEGANPVHGRTRSSAAPIRNAVTSSYVRPTIWMPVGTPLDGATPLGTANTGHAENTLNGVVMKHVNCRSFGPPSAKSCPIRLSPAGMPGTAHVGQISAS